MSDLLSTVRIIAGSTAEIAAASIGDQHLVAAVRLAEEKHSVDTLNGAELPNVKVLVPEVVEVSVNEKAVDEEIVMRKSDAEGEELEELPAVEEATADYGGTEANNPVEAEVADEHPDVFKVASEELSGEMENDLALEKAVSSDVMLSDDDIISEVADVTSATVEEDKASCHETDGLEDCTAPPTLEKDLQATAGAAGDAVDDVELTEATENGNRI